MDDKNFVFQCRGDAYYHKEHSDGTFSVYPLWLSSTLGILHFKDGGFALASRDIPPREEWVSCSEYKLGWRRLYDPYNASVEMAIILYCCEKVRGDIRNFIYPSLQDCLAYAYKQLLSRMCQTVIIHGVGAIHCCGGVLQIDREPQFMWKLVE